MNTIKSFVLAVIVLCRSLFSKDNAVTNSAFVPLKLNLQYFSQDPGDPPADPPADPPSEDEPFATFKSKDEFDKRLTRAERKGQKELAKALGYDSVEAMQEALKKPDEPNNKDKDKDKKSDPVDVDKLVEEKLKAEREKTFTRLRNSEVKIQAKELGFADWEDALALADLSEVKEDDKGNIVGVKEALEELAKKKPHLLKAKSNSFGGSIPNSQQSTTKSLEDIKKMAQSRNASNNTAYNPWAK
ncbi:scaffolding protein [Bacillus sp. RO3]|nr:scaffolding protein [Bacillus sp. RO3]